ncbi:MAG: TetR/AcrR family transcriptional regulator [Bacteroidales bacterium]|jgi:AcrR family transcriptional regulator|nr:TetR/AcrR family transcriptional regulator [Bacteroidales bacterium]
METIEKKPRRRRRTKIEIETDIWAALKRLIIKKNFQNITLVELAKEAQVEPAVLYNRFKNLEEILEIYVRRYDYWLKDAIKIDPKEEPKRLLQKIVANLINELYQNKVMQQVLLWEIGNHSETTRQIAKMREIQAEPMHNYFNAQFDSENNKFGAILSIIIGGVYYLILHRKVSTFGLINFDSEEGKQVLIDTAAEIIERLFVQKNTMVSIQKPQSVIEVAKNMLDLNVNPKIIAQSTGLTAEEIKKLK